MSDASREQPGKRTPLLEVQRDLGAEFKVVDGWSMSAAYGDPVAECRKVREAVGLVDLSHGGAIRVGGSEAEQFLNGLVTNEVRSLGKGKGIRAAFLDGHGKVKALCRILGLGEEYLILNDPQTHERVYNNLFPLSYAGDFKVQEASDVYRILSVQGPKASQVMKEVCFEPVPRLGPHEWMETTICGQRVIVLSASHTGELGYDILVATDGLRDVWDFILLKGAFHSLGAIGLKALDCLRIEAGIPAYGVDVDETNMVLETGISDAVSLNKGCYAGQEAVAMATYRGHVSKKLSGLVVAGQAIPSRGDRIHREGKDVGYVTSAIRSPTLGKVISLGYIKYGFDQPGSVAEIGNGDQVLTSHLVGLPFVEQPTEKRL